MILNYTALLSKRVTEPGPAADLAEIRVAAERGAALTRQLLAFARSEDATMESLDVNAVIRGVGSMLRRTIGAGIDLRLELTKGPALALADRNQLAQVVLNLVINARDAMPDGGRLTISSTVEEEKEQVEIRFSDTGEGMSEEVVARAFEPFFTTKPLGEGTGLGLATVYGIVRQSGGEVTIDSTIGRGTTVTVVLPATSELARAGPGGTGPIPGGSERILVVEDERLLRVATARMVAEHGYEVLTAADGIEALEILEREQGRVALVLSDVAMPRMRGDELGRTIVERYPAVRLLFVSGYVSGSAPLVGRLLAKPVSEIVLLGALRDALDDCDPS